LFRRWNDARKILISFFKYKSQFLFALHKKIFAMQRISKENKYYLNFQTLQLRCWWQKLEKKNHNGKFKTKFSVYNGFGFVLTINSRYYFQISYYYRYVVSKKQIFVTKKSHCAA
jgi:hypothetical protein